MNVDQLRTEAPVLAAEFTQLAVDNPGQFAVLIAGTVVITRAAFNLVRPRTPLQAVALMIVLEVGVPRLAAAALEHGWIRLRVRDDHGRLIDYEPGLGLPDATATAP